MEKMHAPCVANLLKVIRKAELLNQTRPFSCDLHSELVERMQKEPGFSQGPS